MNFPDKSKIRELLKLAVTPILANLVFFVLSRGIEGVLLSKNHQLENLWGDIALSAMYDLPVFAVVSIVVIVIMLLVFPLGNRAAFSFGVCFVFVFHLFHFPILYFFVQTFTPLDRLVFAHSLQEITTTLKTAGINYNMFIVWLLIFAGGFTGAVWGVSRLTGRMESVKWVWVTLLVLFFLAVVVHRNKSGSLEYRRQMVYMHKSAFFYSEVFRHFFSKETNPYSKLPREKQIRIYQENFSAHKYVSTEYPFLIQRDRSNPLGSFFPVSNHPPSVVMIIVEGLGNDFIDASSPVMLMPFLDSLKRESLYWDHFLGVGERSYAVLPSVIGSLPHGEIGFSLLRDMPLHLTLVNQLPVSGYKTGFFYGQGGYFHEKYAFLKRNNIDVFMDKSNFSEDFDIIVDEHSGYHWGYHDQDLFKNYFKSREAKNSAPRLDIFFTGTMHSPFKIDQQDFYDAKYELALQSASLTPAQRSYYLQYEKYLKTPIFTDDALRTFFDEYSRLAEFDNTIFVITGDHPMTEIPIPCLLKRYHVPLIIYSPMLKKPRVISSISSQFDIMPALINLLEQNFGVFAGNFGHMFGSPLDTTSSFSSRTVAPLMRGNRSVDEIVAGEYFLCGDQLFTIQKNMELKPLVNTEVYTRLNSMLQAYNVANNIVVETGKIVPDSVFARYTGLQLFTDTLINFQVNKEKKYHNIFQLPSLNDTLPFAFCYIRGEVSDGSGDDLPVLVFEMRDAEDNVLRWESVGLQTLHKSLTPGGIKYFNRFHLLDHDFFVPGSQTLKVYLWNEKSLTMELTNVEVKLFFPKPS